MNSVNFKRKIIMLIISLTLFFNIERFAMEQDNFLAFSSYVYLLGFAGALLPFLIPVTHHYGSQILTAFFVALYFFCSNFLQLGHPLGGENTYLSATELALLATTVSVAQSLAAEARLLLQETQLFSITEQPSTYTSVAQEWQKLEVEMARCRRYERNLGIILVEYDQPTHTDDEAEPQLHPVIAHSLMLRAIGQLLLHQVRRPDWVLDDVMNSRFLIVCPESNHNDLTTASKRLIASLQQRLNIVVKHGYATFPDDAVTSESLILIAQNRFQHSEPDSQLTGTSLKRASDASTS